MATRGPSPLSRFAYFASAVALLFGPAYLAWCWQTEIPPQVLLLHKIRLKMQQNLSRIPNYTCLETMYRGARPPGRYVVSVPGKEVPFRRIDVLRLEIAEVDGRELLARPGEHSFQDRDIEDFAKGGLFGNGLFSSFARDVFLTVVPVIRYSGEEQWNGRTVVRFNYTVPQIASGYQVGTSLGRAPVGFHGSFWADTKTLDPQRLDVVADDIPPFTGLRGTTSRIDYARVRIGSADVLLPESSVLTAEPLSGGGSENRISFTHCREYGVESVIHFDDTSGSGTAGTNFVEIPSGLQLTLSLQTPVDSDSAQVGDLLTAKVDADVRHRNTVLVPKDAYVSGRLRRLEIHREGWPYVLAALEFINLEFEGKQTRFFAELEKVLLPPGAEGPRRVEQLDLPGVGVVSAPGNRLRLPVGTRMIWKIISYKQASELGKDRPPLSPTTVAPLPQF